MIIASLLLLTSLKLFNLPIDDENEDMPPSVATLPMKCAPRTKIMEMLSHVGAKPLFVAKINPGLGIEFWTDEHNDNWISFITNAAGKSCIVGQGEGYGLADPHVKPMQLIMPNDEHGHPQYNPHGEQQA